MEVTHAKSLTQADSSDTSLARPVDWNSKHGLKLNLSAGPGGTTLGSSNVTGPAMTLVAGPNIAFSGDTANTKWQIGVGPTRSQLQPIEWGNNSSLSSLVAGSVFLQYFNVPPGGLVFDRIDRMISLSMNASYSESSNHTGSISNSWGYTESFGIYSRQTGANSTLLGLMTSSSWSMGLSESRAIGTNGATTVSMTQSGAIGFIGSIDSAGNITTATFSSTASLSSATSATQQANVLSNVTGLNMIEIPWGSSNSLPGGDYWLAVIPSSQVTTAGSATTLGSISHMVMTAYTSGLKLLGQTATNSSNRMVEGNGYYASAALPANLTMSSISNPANISLYFNMVEMDMKAT